MNSLYKIETFCESSVKQLADSITKSGGQCVIRGWAVISDHVFSESQSDTVFHLVARITDVLTDDDIYFWSNAGKRVA